MLSSGQRKKADRRLRRKMPKTGCIVYALFDPVSGAPRYVGQTRTSIDTRLINHLRGLATDTAAGRKLSPCQQWIADHLDAGRMPVIEALQQSGTWDASEAAWIERLTACGAELFNVRSRIPRS